MTPLVYLACPYSHPDPAVREARFHAVNRAAGEMMGRDMLVFSPISHSHPIAVDHGLPTDFAYWAAYNRATLSRCDRLVVLCLPGWRDSVGVRGELAIAHETGIPVEFLDSTGDRP